MENNIATRISALRDLMRQSGIAATIIPQSDPHLSEYLADHWQVRRWLSGFTGSAGALVVTLDQAFVWADSRYWLQAANQLKDTPIQVMEEGKPEVPEIADYLCHTLKTADVVGVDGMVFSIDAIADLRSRLAAKGIELNTDFDPATLWADRPSLPKDPVFIHDVKFAGESAVDKISRVLDRVVEQGASSVLISDLAEVAWILNLRSSDVESNPVVMAFLYLRPQDSTLFVDLDKLSPEVTAYLSQARVDVKPYGAVVDFLKALPADERVLVSSSQTAASIRQALGDRAVVGSSPAALLKACKNDVQIAHVRDAMVADGVALVKAFMEIEYRLSHAVPLTEMDVAEILTHYRSLSPLYFDQSFDTIAGYGPHGAIVHYSATPATNSTIHPEGMLLIDSGANYLNGTTDITRTITLGNTTDAQRHDFTLVMKGHIALVLAIYPAGTRGAQLDALARINLWREGLSYLHGTGHGVGFFLNVHEGPQSIRLNNVPATLQPGMITSNEPGLYRAGEYGIRCENLVLTVPAFTTEFGDFYRFETLTLFPFDLNLFDTSIMTDEEIQWVNDYHDMVRSRLLPHLNPQEQSWLVAKTQPLTR